MSTDPREKPSASFTLHPSTQDSAINLTDQSEAQIPPMIPPHTESSAPDAQNEDAQPQEDTYDNASDSGFDSGSLLGDETDTLASSIMHYRQAVPTVEKDVSSS